MIRHKPFGLLCLTRRAQQYSVRAPTGDIVTITLAVPRELVVANRTHFKATAITYAQGADVLILDCAETGYIDGAALGMLVSLRKAIQPTRLVLAGLNEDMRVLMVMTRLDGLFEFSERVAA